MHSDEIAWSVVGHVAVFVSAISQSLDTLLKVVGHVNVDKILKISEIGKLGLIQVVGWGEVVQVSWNCGDEWGDLVNQALDLDESSDHIAVVIFSIKSILEESTDVDKVSFGSFIIWG